MPIGSEVFAVGMAKLDLAFRDAGLDAASRTTTTNGHRIGR